MADPHAVAGVLSRVARALQAEPDEQATLARVVRTAVDTVPGAAYGGITQVHRRQVSAREPSDPVVRKCDELQAELGQGPCVDAIWTQQTVLVDEMGSETRWPRFTARAAELGVGGLLSFRLYVREDTLGALNLYSDQGVHFDDESRLLGELFATHAAVALAEARHTRHLNEALASRDTIGQAKGLLMAQHGLTDRAAFDLLVAASQETNLKLTTVAGWIVDEHHHPGGTNRPARD